MSVGVRRQQIVLLFLAEGFILAVIGAFSGILCGYFLVFLMNRIGIPISAPGSTFKIMMRPFLFTDWVLVNGFLTVLFTSAISFWPAYRASRLDPVEALQST
jgi:putative ABC transport system permease protein